jgi:hypothetical protein
MSDHLLSLQFRRWRFIVRFCFFAGVALLLGLRLIPDLPFNEAQREFLVFTGLGLIAATFIFYYSRANRCPKCRRSFSGASEYQSSETDGLALFGSIKACPFCGLNLQ